MSAPDMDGHGDAGDFEIECSSCGSVYIAGENIGEDGESCVCPDCGAVFGDIDDGEGFEGRGFDDMGEGDAQD